MQQCQSLWALPRREGIQMENEIIDLVIFGTGGHAREMHDLVMAVNQQRPIFNFLGFLDQLTTPLKKDTELILGDHTWLRDKPKVRVVIAIGNAVSRLHVRNLISSVCSNKFQTLIHPTAYIGPSCKIGDGSMISAGAVLTCGVTIGEHVIVNIRASLSHEALVEDFVTIAPNATICGAVSIATGADIGASATIIQLKKIGAWSIVGAGTVVIKDVVENVTVVGNPARQIAERKSGWQNN